MSYVNTVDSKGDAAICKSILHKTLDAITDTYCEMVGGYAFYKFLALHTAIFANARSIEQYAFAYCSKLETVEFPLSKSVGYFSFYECTKLEEADFPCVTSVGRYAFNGCTALKTLILRSGTLATLSDVNALEDTPIESGKGYVYVPSALLESYKADSKWSTFANQFRKLEDYTVDGTITGEIDLNRHMVRFFDEDGTFLCYIMVPTGGNAVYPGEEPTKEGEWEFTGWGHDLTNVTADMDCYAKFRFTGSFARKMAARTITSYEDDVVEKVRDYAFYNSTALTTVNLPAVTSIGNYAFNGCASLTTTSFPVTTSIGNSAFHKCYALTTVNFPVATSIDNYAFQYCSKLTTADFPVATSIGNSAFDGCTPLTTADFPVATSVGNNVFYNCRALTTVNFPVATSVGNNAFYGCSSLTTANFPAATSIGSGAFNGCSKLTTADFPVATSVGNNVFYNCSALTTLILRNTAKVATLSATNAFTNTPIASGTGYIYVPRDLVESYKTATNWSTYAAQFRAIEDYPDICGGGN